MTPEQLDRLEQLARDATPGPWQSEGQYVLTRPSDDAVMRSFGFPTPRPLARMPPARTVVAEGTRSHDQQDEADAAYIAALSPDVVSRLVAMARGVDGLDAAWRAAEEALPEGWRLDGVFYNGSDADVWQADASAPVTGSPTHYGIGLTPATALLALAEKMRERP